MNFFETFESDHDENMTKKFGNNYKYLKSLYPQASQLPKEELSEMVNIARWYGDTLEEGQQELNKYIKQNEPKWQKQYFTPQQQSQPQQQPQQQSMQAMLNPQKAAMQNAGQNAFQPQPAPATQPQSAMSMMNGVAMPQSNPPSTQNTEQNSPFNQVIGAFGDLKKNYYDMKNDNTIGNDSYFHCKGNYEGASRGKYGELTTKKLGEIKEQFDYFKNRILNGLSYPDAMADYHYDLSVNDKGRQQYHTKLYDNSKDACNFLRVNGINDKY